MVSVTLKFSHGVKQADLLSKILLKLNPQFTFYDPVIHAKVFDEPEEK
jgi:hypothetical protein